MTMDKLEAHILIIDDDKDVLHTAKMVLKPYFAKIETEKNPEQIGYLISHNVYAVILLDMNYTAGLTSGKEGLFWLKRILEKNPEQQVVMMTAYGDLKLAVEAMKIGAADFIVKPWENEKLHATILSAYKHSQSKKELTQLKSKQNRINEILSSTERLIGNSTSMQTVYNTIRKVATTEANVLILGENGTGKELVAKSIHQQSKRSAEVFAKVDLGAISESLFESELFGHKKGAFTDAKDDRTGRFTLAQGGTLFLDEIGNLSLPMQAKMLTAIQSKSISPVGSDSMIEIDCRIVAATNEDLHQKVHQKMFREDLLYRINTVEILIPPLRARLDDIIPLAEHFLNVYNAKYRKELRLADDVLAHLKSYSWPGNVRELQHAIERAVIMAEGNDLGKNDFLFNNRQPINIQDSLRFEEVEKNTIERAIAKYDGNITKVAAELGLGRTTIYRKMEKYGIK